MLFRWMLRDSLGEEWEEEGEEEEEGVSTVTVRWEEEEWRNREIRRKAG